jgi:hypothetical protein
MKFCVSGGHQTELVYYLCTSTKIIKALFGLKADLLIINRQFLSNIKQS